MADPASERPAAPRPARAARPLVLAHRGASGHRPEHTLAAYALGARLGADVIECDLVPTRDGALVARHESELSQTTDIADRPEFAGRRTTKAVDGVAQSGWFTEDLALAELRGLRARERLPELRPANAAWDGRLVIPTLEEIFALARALTRELGRPVGVACEVKHPARFRRLGLPLEEPLVAALRACGPATHDAPAWIQSFEADSLRRLRGLVDVRLVQLVGAAEPCDLEAIATWADAVGPAKALLSGHAHSGPAPFVAAAHRAGLAVLPWTYRAENAFLPAELRSSPDPAAHGDLHAELTEAFAHGVDGVFCDHPEVAVSVLGRC